MVVYNGKQSHSFSLSQGVRQGSILSPHLYNIYTEELLKEIKSLAVGTVVNSIHTGIITYADDIILMSTTLSGLQSMINCCINYGIKNKIKFNSLKTEFIVSGNSHILEPFIYVDQHRVKPKSSLTHLRFHWSIGNKTRYAAIDNSHIKHRLNEFLAATTSLVSVSAILTLFSHCLNLYCFQDFYMDLNCVI